jgi:hypothetical protein
MLNIDQDLHHAIALRETERAGNLNEDYVLMNLCTAWSYVQKALYDRTVENGNVRRIKQAAQL